MKNVLNYKKPAFWVIIIAVVLCAVLSVSFLKSSKPKYQIRITVPAGSKQGFFYSDEEICSKKGTITISCGDGLSDTLVNILHVEAKEEENEGQYLTPGLPVKFKAEKGKWYKVGVIAQNPSDEDINVYVSLKDVDVRIGSSTRNSQTVPPSSDVGDANVEQTIEVQVPFIDLSATTGADGSRLYYADKVKFIFGDYYGLFVYDMTEKEITRAIRLSAIGCDATQGDSACEISVTNDGTKVFLHPMNQAQMYVYHVVDNKMTLEDYNLDGYNLYQNQYSGDEYGKLASYEVDGEVRYVVLVNDMTIGELGYTPDERMSSYQVIFNKQDLNHLHE